MPAESSRKHHGVDIEALMRTLCSDTTDIKSMYLALLEIASIDNIPDRVAALISSYIINRITQEEFSSLMADASGIDVPSDLDQRSVRIQRGFLILCLSQLIRFMTLPLLFKDLLYYEPPKRDVILSVMAGFPFIQRYVLVPLIFEHWDVKKVDALRAFYLLGPQSRHLVLSPLLGLIHEAAASSFFAQKSYLDLIAGCLVRFGAFKALCKFIMNVQLETSFRLVCVQSLQKHTAAILKTCSCETAPSTHFNLCPQSPAIHFFSDGEASFYLTATEDSADAGGSAVQTLHVDCNEFRLFVELAFSSIGKEVEQQSVYSSQESTLPGRDMHLSTEDNPSSDLSATLVRSHLSPTMNGILSSSDVQFAAELRARNEAHALSHSDFTLRSFPSQRQSARLQQQQQKGGQAMHTSFTRGPDEVLAPSPRPIPQTRALIRARNYPVQQRDPEPLDRATLKKLCCQYALSMCVLPAPEHKQIVLLLDCLCRIIKYDQSAALRTFSTSCLATLLLEYDVGRCYTDGETLDIQYFMEVIIDLTRDATDNVREVVIISLGRLLLKYKRYISIQTSFNMLHCITYILREDTRPKIRNYCLLTLKFILLGNAPASDDGEPRVATPPSNSPTSCADLLVSEDIDVLRQVFLSASSKLCAGECLCLSGYTGRKFLMSVALTDTNTRNRVMAIDALKILKYNILLTEIEIFETKRFLLTVLSDPNELVVTAAIGLYGVLYQQRQIEEEAGNRLHPQGLGGSSVEAASPAAPVTAVLQMVPIRGRLSFVDAEAFMRLVKSSLANATFMNNTRLRSCLLSTVQTYVKPEEACTLLSDCLSRCSGMAATEGSPVTASSIASETASSLQDILSSQKQQSFPRVVIGEILRALGNMRPTSFHTLLSLYAKLKDPRLFKQLDSALGIHEMGALPLIRTAMTDDPELCSLIALLKDSQSGSPNFQEWLTNLS